jgi:ATP-dependent helicase HrpB
VCVDTDAGRRGERAEALVRVASGVRDEDLPAERLRSADELEFDARRERVVAWRRTRLDALLVREVEVGVEPGPQVERVLAEAAARDPERALALDDEVVAGFLARVRSLAHWRPELELPRFDEGDLARVLAPLCAGRADFAALRQAARSGALRGVLTWEQAAALERDAPERIEVPSGSRVALAYEPGRPPVLAVRLQELFGLRETPRIAGGRVAVLLHLLGPNFRPQQVTDDLASFWENTYPVVRKELRARYPKHAWPEDPWSAAPESRPRRK